MIEGNQDVMFNRVKSGRRSAVIRIAEATSLSITVASFVKSILNGLYFPPCSMLRYFISIVRVIVIAGFIVVLNFVVAFKLCNSSIDEILVEGSVIPSIDAILAGDKSNFRSLLLST